MNLSLDEPTLGYKSASQIARITTEKWVRENLFCPNCGGRLFPYASNTKTKDVFCRNCAESYQIKSKKGKFGNKLIGAEYNTTKLSFQRGDHPSLILIHYSPVSWLVIDVQVIHRAYITLSSIIPRKPLGKNARRAGWQGCNYDLSQIPASARIKIVDNHHVEQTERVLARWKSAQSILEIKQEGRRWVADVLRIVETLPLNFDLADVYRYKSNLEKLYPTNHHVEAKIRQQLQILREIGKVEFVDRGKYRRLV